MVITINPNSVWIIRFGNLILVIYFNPMARANEAWIGIHVTGAQVVPLGRQETVVDAHFRVVRDSFKSDRSVPEDTIFDIGSMTGFSTGQVEVKINSCAGDVDDSIAGKGQEGSVLDLCNMLGVNKDVV
jgi:hypothetical protein